MNRKIIITFFIFCYIVIFYGFALGQPDDSEIKDNDLKIELCCDKTEFIQGESIDLLIKIRNNTIDTINIGLPKHFLYDVVKDSTFSKNIGHSHSSLFIPSFGTYYFILDPSDWQIFPERMDHSTLTLKPGNYEYYVSGSLNRKKYISNKLKINVKPVPDSLKKAFNDLMFKENNFTTLESAEQLLAKYKGTFYEKRFYRKVFGFNSYYYAIQNKKDAKDYRKKAVNLYKEFILKFPNNSLAYGEFQVIMFNYADNQTLVEEILTSLKNNQPECKLLEVLRNQPEYLHKKLKHLLY